MREDQAVITRRLSDDIANDQKLTKEVIAAYQRFKRGDWGNTHPDDAKLNDEALEDGVSRIIAKYETSKKPIFIINNDEPYDKDAAGNVIIKRITTIMYCDEY